MTRVALAILTAPHGVAHLVGFVGPRRVVAPDRVPYGTMLLADGVDLGGAAARAVGLLWLLAALAFWVAAAGAVASRRWSVPVALGAALASLVLCALGWPDARIGVAKNLAIVAALRVGGQRIRA